MIRRFTTYVSLITCDSATDDCEATLREVAESQHMADLAASRAAEYEGWARVARVGGRLTIHRCPAHRDEVAHLDADGATRGACPAWPVPVL